MSGPSPSLGPEFWGQERVLLKLFHKKGQKVDQVQKRVIQGWQTGSVESWKQLNPLSQRLQRARCCSRCNMAEGSLEMLFSFLNSHMQSKGQAFQNLPCPSSTSSTWKSDRQRANLPQGKKTLLHYLSILNHELDPNQLILGSGRHWHLRNPLEHTKHASPDYKKCPHPALARNLMVLFCLCNSTRDVPHVFNPFVVI